MIGSVVDLLRDMEAFPAGTRRAITSPETREDPMAARPCLEPPTSQAATMKVHHDIERTRNSNFEAGTALDNLRVEMVDIEALAAHRDASRSAAGHRAEAPPGVACSGEVPCSGDRNESKILQKGALARGGAL
jgi:hypothetical protein